MMVVEQIKKCIKCGRKSEQDVIISYSLKSHIEPIMQKCPYCGYTSYNIEIDNSKNNEVDNNKDTKLNENNS